MDKRELSQDLKGSYELCGIEPGELIWKGQRYDFRRMSKDIAASLVKAGCPYIQEVKKPSTKETK